MNKLHSIHVRTGTPEADYLDTVIHANLENEGFRKTEKTTAQELACPAFGTLAAWLLAEAQQGGWVLEQSFVTFAGEIIVGREVVRQEDGTVTVLEGTPRRTFEVSLTMSKDGGEHTRELRSETMPETVRIALIEFWDAVAAKFP